MTEHSILWSGNTIGDAVNAPLDPDEIAAAMYYFFEYCPLPGLGYRAGAGAYENYPFYVTIETKNIYQIGAVIKGYLNSLEVTNPSGLNVQIDTGGAIVDGRFYMADAAPLVDVVVAPGSGFNYYLLGIRMEYSAQTVTADMIGPETSINDLVQPMTRGDDYLLPLAVVKVSSGSVVTVYDCRRFITPNGYQQVRVINRQGGSASNWSLSGTNNYVPESEVGVVAACIRTPLAFNPLDISPIVFATPKATNAVLAVGSVPSSESEGILVNPFDGSTVAGDRYAFAIIVGNDNPDRYTTRDFYAYVQYTEETS